MEFVSFWAGKLDLSFPTCPLWTKLRIRTAALARYDTPCGLCRVEAVVLSVPSWMPMKSKKPRRSSNINWVAIKELSSSY